MIDIAELKRWALNTGQSVTLPDGTVFNSAGRKMMVKPKTVSTVMEPTVPTVPTAIPTVAQQPTRAAEPDRSHELAAALRRVAELESAMLDMRQMMSQISAAPKPAIPAPAPEPAPAPAFRFEIERDSDGFISTVRAVPETAEVAGLGTEAIKIAKRFK